MLEAMVAGAFGLEEHDLGHILRDCDLPAAGSSAHHIDPKGFWRLDSDTEPELRRTVLTQIAFSELPQFTAQATDEWLLPETLRLADYGLGHDDRANHHQPVATALGPRFYDWQLAQTAEEANHERHLHARNLLGELEYARLRRELERRDRPRATEPLRQVAEEREEYEARPPDDDQQDIFE